MKISEFKVPEHIVSGNGSVATVAALIRDRNIGRNVFVMTSKSGLSHVRFLCEQLEQFGLRTVIDASIFREPLDEDVWAITERARQFQPDLIVALGGGSVLDAAKAVAIELAHGLSATQFAGANQLHRDLLPIVAIPTTAGTGSEVTRFTVLTRASNHEKLLISDWRMLPDVAVIDPTLTTTMPAMITASTGMDALTHAIEAYISAKSQPLADGLALSAISRITKNLRSAWERGDDLGSRHQVMIGAMEAGLAFSNASVALVHGMSRPIGAKFEVPHGLANAILLPGVMRYTLSGAVERYADIARAMDFTAGSDEALAHQAVDAVAKMCLDLNIPSLQSYGIESSLYYAAIPQMIEEAFASGSPMNNPRVPTEPEMTHLYRQLMENGHDRIA